MATDIVEKVLNAGNFRECFESLHECKLEDILLYELNQKLTFTTPDQDFNSNVIELENVLLNPMWSEESKRGYSKQTLTNFLQYKIQPKRGEMLKRIQIKNRLTFFGAGILGSLVVLGSSSLVPPAYLGLAIVGYAAGISAGFFGIRRYIKKTKEDLEHDKLLTIENKKLFKEVNTFDLDGFIEKNRDDLREKIDGYFQKLDEYQAKH